MPITEYFTTREGKSRVMRPDAMVQMYGPCFSGSGEIVNREVPERDVLAFKNAGYQFGSVEVKESPKEVEPEAPKAAPKRGKK